MSTTKSLMTGNPGSGLSSILFFLITDEIGVIHANPFLPLMFIPSEPQTPSLHDLRYEMD